MEPDPLVLVTGAGGQVGQALRHHLTSARLLTHADLDVRDARAVERAMDGVATVFHLAALTNVDLCERNPGDATDINDLATKTVADAAARVGAKVIYLSTDYVFDGTKKGEYVETDEPHPINIYGRTKLAGERHVRAHDANLVVRTSWVYGEGTNFVRKMVELAMKGASLKVVDDQVGRPTAAVDLAAALVALDDAGATGVIHAAGGGRPCTWADLAERALELAGLSAEVERVTTAGYAAAVDPPPAPRPPNSALSIELLRGKWGIEMPSWERSLSDYLEATR